MEKDEKRLTEHFRMDEFVYSAMAVELGLNNASVSYTHLTLPTT